MPSDQYFGLVGRECVGNARAVDGSDQAFVDNLRVVRTFITHARYDANVYTPAIPYVLHSKNLGASIDSAPRPGVARPGWFRVDFPAQSDGGAVAKAVEVRFPPYDAAGHMVAATQPADLAADVQAWLQEP